MEKIIDRLIDYENNRFGRKLTVMFQPLCRDIQLIVSGLLSGLMPNLYADKNHRDGDCSINNEVTCLLVSFQKGMPIHYPPPHYGGGVY